MHILCNIKTIGLIRTKPPKEQSLEALQNLEGDQVRLYTVQEMRVILDYQSEFSTQMYYSEHYTTGNTTLGGLSDTI